MKLGAELQSARVSKITNDG